MIDSWNSCVNFLNRLIPFFPKEKVSVKPEEQRLIILEASFVEEISGMVITKIPDTKEQKNSYHEIKIHKKQSDVQGDK